MAKIFALRAKNWQTRRYAPSTRQFLAALRLKFFNAIFQRRISLIVTCFTPRACYFLQGFVVPIGAKTSCKEQAALDGN